MGNIAQMKPAAHPYLASAVGKTIVPIFRISEPEHTYLTPAKLLAMTAINLLYGDAALKEDSRGIQIGDAQRRLP
ncbi:MAG: hypothetical protein JO007_17475 [Alphaproteobacteria bacterium]|nr:hypothetical protein [Alphaproteobacteria bacterium]